MFLNKINEPTVLQAAEEIGLTTLFVKHLVEHEGEQSRDFREASFFELGTSDYNQASCNLCHMPTSTILLYPKDTLKKIHFDATDLDPEEINLVVFDLNLKFEIAIVHYCEFCQKFLEPFLNVNISTETLENFWQILAIHTCPFCNQHHHTELQRAMVEEGLKPLSHWPNLIAPSIIAQLSLSLH